ncbi:MAG: hypothetical protein PHP26_06425 [Syntrophomonas sp.]|nr:hypothetical protein [Syntrophomonas sp.]MDD2510662.1 hypothetical protein [Syntrophomonas sp.]MDD3879609.1 hypothetical protein [Syntrophomonas sp.]MDD4627455.1 hypothetical protein [Syntrophomonas sp.]
MAKNKKENKKDDSIYPDGIQRFQAQKDEMIGAPVRKKKKQEKQ